MDWVGMGFRVCEVANFKLDLHLGGSDDSIGCKW